MKVKLFALLIVVTVAGASGAYAHHSFPATYQIGKVMTLHGTIAQFLVRNPHSFIHIDAVDADGRTQRWALEWGGAAQLLNQGVMKDSLKVGDKVEITANPPRSTADATRALLKTIVRPSDGWSWGLEAGQVVD
jgi:hypothetical protein